MSPVEETEEHIRVRIRDPKGFQEDSFRTIYFGKGIQAVIGRPKGSEDTKIQALLFDKDRYDRHSALSWVRKQSYGKTLKVKQK